MATELVLRQAAEALWRLEQALDQLEALALDDLFDGRLAEVREVCDDLHVLLEMAEPDLLGPDDDDEDTNN